MDAGREPIADDEIIYRRIPATPELNLYSTETRILSEQAFAPSKRDTTGLSVVRSKYSSIEAAAQGRPGKKYFVAVLRAGDIRAVGVQIEPRPDTDEGYDPAHAELATLNAENRKSTVTLETMERLVQICLRVEGPFETPI